MKNAVILENEYLDQKQINDVEEQLRSSLEKNHKISLRKLFKYNLYETFLPYSKDSMFLYTLIILTINFTIHIIHLFRSLQSLIFCL